MNINKVFYSLLLISVLVLSLVIVNKNKKITDLTNRLQQYENMELPSKGEIDSLCYNISYKDSIIKQITIEYVKDVEWVKNMPDSAAITLFNQLVWADENAD